MSDPKVSKEKMIEHFRDFQVRDYMDCVHPFRKGGYCPECHAISALIESSDKGMEVDEEAIVHLIQLLIDNGPLWSMATMPEEGKAIDIISKWLLEVGVKVKEAVDDRKA